MSTDLVNPKEFGLEKENAKTIEDAFKPKIMERDNLTTIYNDLIKKELTTELCFEANELKKKFVKVRTGIAQVHKTQKAYFLAAGRFVDAWKNKETLPITQMEEKLVEIEKHFEKIEEDRINKLQAVRVELLKPYVEDAETRELRYMDDDVWEAFLSTKKAEFEKAQELKKRMEEEEAERLKKAEEERLKAEKEAAAKQKRIEAENKRLKAKLKKEEEAKKKAEAIRLKAEKEAEKIKLKAEKEAEAKRLKAEQEAEAERLKAEKIKEEAAEKVRLANEKAAKLVQEIKDKEKAEAEAIEAERLRKEQEREAELAKGDEQKIDDLINELTQIKSGYEFKSTKNKDKFLGVKILIDKVITYIEK